MILFLGFRAEEPEELCHQNPSSLQGRRISGEVKEASYGLEKL